MIELKNAPFEMPGFDLTGKVAIITGSTMGLGYGMAVAFSMYGAKVVINSENEEDCIRVSNEINEMGGTTIPVKADVRVKAEIDAMVAKTVEVFGKVDIIVNNAGLGITKRVVEMTEDEWDTVVEIGRAHV